MFKKTCKDCIYAEKKSEELIYCNKVNWIMNMESPACIEHINDYMSKLE